MRYPQMAIPVGLMAGLTLVAAGLVACGGATGIGESSADPIVTTGQQAPPNGPPVNLDQPELPTALYDYETYAQSLPAHFFTQTSQVGAGSVADQDNTPAGNPITNDGATLGRVLFYDTKLSVNDTIACASCHKQENGFGDPRTLSIGFEGVKTDRHSPALANAAFYKRGHFFWDERADTLEVQTLMPIQSPVEMGMTLDALEPKLQATTYYPELFNRAFGTTTVTRDGISKALAQFVRSLVSYQSKFDEMMSAGPAGTPDLTKFTAQELRGMALFGGGPEGNDDSVGCHFCHDTTAQVATDVFNNGLDAVTTDVGAGNGSFKIASLRNVEVSAPYMHDGRFKSLREVVDFYDHGVQDNPDLADGMRNPDTGLPSRLNLSREDRDALVAFLRTLTDRAFLNDQKFSDPFRRSNTGGGNNAPPPQGGAGNNPPPQGGGNNPPPPPQGGNGGGPRR